MILLCDSGSTKADWVVLEKKTVKFAFQTPGLNPVNLSEKELLSVLSTVIFQKIASNIRAIHFYGSGCGNEEGKSRMVKVLRKKFLGATITVENDLMAAARATCGKEKGIVAILGTGSNCCYFDGKKIHIKNFGLGYILGDEGSGTFFGKKFLQAYLYGQLPAALAKKFFNEYRIDRQIAIDAVYRKPNPNLFLSSFMPFIIENKSQVFVRKFIQSGLEEFFSSTILSFPEAKKAKVHFTGSIASLLEKEIRSAGVKKRLRIGNILRQPMPGLVKYYLSK